MTDSFFDLGKALPQVDARALEAHLSTQPEVFEKAFVPTTLLAAAKPGDTLQFKHKTFKRMRFYETHFFRVTFTRCTFDECLFLGAHFEECAFHECTFIKCNTNKFRLTRTYLDPRSFLENIFDRKKYPNIGVDLFHTLLKNSAEETQPEFRDTAEYYFKLWQRYNRVSYWNKSNGAERWLNWRFFAFWVWNLLYQLFFGYGVRTRNILFWTPALLALAWGINYLYWPSYGIDSAKLPSASLWAKCAFFTVGNLTTFGTAELTPTTEAGLFAVSVQVIAGIIWIALSTAMIVKRFVR